MQRGMVVPWGPLTPPRVRLAVGGLGRADTQVAAAMIMVITPDNCIVGYGLDVEMRM
jgi:hypothetical protein